MSPTQTARRGSRGTSVCPSDALLDTALRAVTLIGVTLRQTLR
jgi:hypothetical protein